MPAPKQKFTAEFKREAVRLVQTTGKSCAQITRDLGIPPHYVVRWKKELEIARQERDMLKKALACLGQNGTCIGPARFFAKQP